MFHANAIFDFHTISMRNARSNTEEREREEKRRGKSRVKSGEGAYIGIERIKRGTYG